MDGGDIYQDYCEEIGKRQLKLVMRRKIREVALKMASDRKIDNVDIAEVNEIESLDTSKQGFGSESNSSFN
jgi:hypothetical protein